MKGLPVDALSDTLAAGIERVAAAGSDLVLVDPQYSRFLRANADLEPYQRALEQAAAEPDVSLFRRFDLMHAWVEAAASTSSGPPPATARRSPTRCMPAWDGRWRGW